jgi:hypothetical protein
MYQFHNIDQAQYDSAMDRIQSFLSPAPPPMDEGIPSNLSSDEIDRLEQEIREEGTNGSSDLDIQPAEDL